MSHDVAQFITPGSEILRQPSCSIEFAAPNEIEKFVVDGQNLAFFVGIRRPGDPSDFLLKGIGWLPGSTGELINLHESGFTRSAPLQVDSQGRFEISDRTPIPSDWPLGKWQVQIHAQGADGATIIEICGKFELRSSLTDPVTSDVTGNGLSQQVVLIAAGLGIVTFFLNRR